LELFSPEARSPTRQDGFQTTSVWEIDFAYDFVIQLLIVRSGRFNQHNLIDTTPMPDGIPKVQEIGATSAPLMSASFFIGDRCRPYNDDYMKCKSEANGRGEIDCLKEGRKVTRCAASVYVFLGRFVFALKCGI
jgi:hypothetical protein